MSNNMLNDIEEVLLTEEQIDKICREMGAKISADYEGKNLLLVGLLKGSIVFMSQLMKYITIPCKIDFMIASSYGSSTETSGVVEIKKDITTPIEGYHILIVEDILDTGVTLSNVLPLLLEKGAKSVKIATLLNKPERRRCEVKLDYQGMEIPDKFVVGYGLDYNEEYRNLPFVGILKPCVYEK